MPVLQSLWISNFVYFYSFHTLKALTAPPAGANNGGSALRDLCLGTVAGVINVLATTPFWVVNTRLKMRGLAADAAAVNKGRSGATTDSRGSSTASVIEYANLVDGLAYVWRTEGAAGLWAGAMPSLMLVSNPALQFMAYEWLKRHLAAVSAQPPAVAFFAIGAMAKAFATVATYPLQLIQTKLRHGTGSAGGAANFRTAAGSAAPPAAGVLEMFVYILKAHGVEGLFRGLEAKLLQTVLTAALMFAAYEKIAGTVMSLLVRSKGKQR